MADGTRADPFAKVVAFDTRLGCILVMGVESTNHEGLLDWVHAFQLSISSPNRVRVGPLRAARALPRLVATSLVSHAAVTATHSCTVGLMTPTAIVVSRHSSLPNNVIPIQGDGCVVVIFVCAAVVHGS